MKLKILIFCLSLNFASYPQPSFERLYVPEGGVPLHLTYCMMQDSRGFIWFGTMYGLVRYDGKDYKIYRHDPDDKSSISFDDIVALHEDAEGNLWIGTWGGGINIFNPISGTFKRFKPADTGNIIWNIKEDASGNTWFTAEQFQLKKFNPQKEVKSYPVRDVRKIFMADGVPLFATGKGVKTYDKESDSIIDDARFNRLKDLPVDEICMNSSGDFIVAADKKIFLLQPKEGEVLTLYQSSGETIHKVIAGSDNSIWAATSNGLRQIKAGMVKVYVNDPENPASIYGNVVQDIFFDHSGLLWISSYNRGISNINFDRMNFYSFRLSYPKCFGEDTEGNIWAGSLGAGLLKIDPLSGSFKVYDSGISEIQDLQVKGKNILYVNRQGLFSYDIQSGQNKNILTGSFRVMAAVGDRVFLGTEGRGLLLYNRKTRSLNSLRFEFQGLTEQHNYILTLFADSRERLWIGTYGGLVKLDLRTFKDELYKYDPDNKKSLSNNYVYNIFEDANKTLWVATSNGLNKFSADLNTFARFYEKNGLPNGVINGITADSHNNLWLTTNKGLSKYDPYTGVFTNYNNKKGLAENVFLPNSIFCDSKGFVYAGSAEGLTYFYPDSITTRTYEPEVIITSLYSRNQELIPSNSILLNQDQNYFTVKFASLDYADPAANRFRYKLIGFDDNWIYTGTVNSAAYTNVPPGDYEFILNGTNSDGVWSKKEARLKLTILPPFWQTWWFISSSAILIILLFILSYRLKIRRDIKLALSVQEAREEENAAVRKKTAVDFHDELGHRLTRVSLLTELIRRHNPGQEVLPLLNKITDNVKELYTGMKDFIWAIDPKDDSLYELLIRLKDFGDDLFSDSQVQFEVNGFDENYKALHLPMDYRRQLILLFKEGMNNSIKYAGSDKVILESRIYDDLLEMSLTDFGVGISSPGNQGRGLEGMKKRAEMLKGELKIDTNPGHGTKIVFRGRLIKNLQFN